ncbi:hypothetical protein, partial [Burkholderia gladioli]|uniref:hypothetical protein n=1 Tax=Burkholderia gladioli TaxID=28095 RepID=UPI001ABB166C
CPQLVVDDWLAHLLVSVVPMPEVNSSPRKLTAPRALFETVSYRHWAAYCLNHVVDVASPSEPEITVEIAAT